MVPTTLVLCISWILTTAFADDPVDRGGYLRRTRALSQIKDCETIKKRKACKTRKKPKQLCKWNVQTKSCGFNRPICPFLDMKKCKLKTHKKVCAWKKNACKVRSPAMWDSGIPSESPWNGFAELAQTHVVRAVGELRHAPRAASERETELLFTPTEEAPPTPPPTSAPTGPVTHDWGLETSGGLPVARLPAGEGGWPASFPRDAAVLVDGKATEYYLPNSRPNVDVDFDLSASRVVQGVKLKSWYVTKIQGIRVGVKADDGEENGSEEGASWQDDDGWDWYDGPSITSDVERIILIPKATARYVRIELRGGNSSSGSNWGLRNIYISGYLDGLRGESRSGEESGGGSAFFPEEGHPVWVAAYSSDGALLGTLDARSPGLQRPLLEQSLTSTALEPYSQRAWSATLPWDWAVLGTQIKIGTVDPDRPSRLLVHQLKLTNLASWGQHTLTRGKIAVFGDAEDLASLDATTKEAPPLAAGMFGSMPVAEIRWVDTELWHLPYLVVRTSDGPRRVSSETERRAAHADAGDDPGTEPKWEILKNQLTLRHNVANTGEGLGKTTLNKLDSSPYASGTSIFMAWSMTKSNKWDKLGYWEGWSAAGSTGWTSMRGGDECGNTLIHEVGHSQTFGHFTAGSAESWGIADEYPQDGVNLEHHPWGYDTVSRRFRTWYKHNSITKGKHDPMNGGEPPNAETCFPQYTAYHASKAQKWAINSPILLSSNTSNVPKDGVYIFSEQTKAYALIDSPQAFDAQVGKYAQMPDRLDAPVVTLVGTLGDRPAACQIYPGLRSASGNAFRFPDPFGSGLRSDVWDGAAYALELRHEGGPDRWALIAAEKIPSASEAMNMFSLNVALADRPFEARLYRFEQDSYPDLTSESSKTLLFVRSIDSSDSSLADLPHVVRVGRGWLGSSYDYDIRKLCISDKDCDDRPRSQGGHEWTGTTRTAYSASPKPLSFCSDADEFRVRAVRQEDDTSHFLGVLGSRYYDTGTEIASYPLTTDVSAIETQFPPDVKHGIKFWAPYGRNLDLEPGTYVTSRDDALVVSADGAPVAGVRLRLQLSALTATVDLSPGKGFFESDPYFAPDSSSYFLAVDPAVGPTDGTWWGGARDTLVVPLMSDCLPDGESVAWTVKAQQRAGGSVWQMSAGRGEDDVGHVLRLDADDSPGANPWTTAFLGCRFATHPARPVEIEARRWHDPDAKKLLGTLVLGFVLNM